MTGKAFCICGIDPGNSSGALAWYCPAEPSLVTTEDLPFVLGGLDAGLLACRIEARRPDFAMIEGVSAMPKQGVSSTFKFGRGFGIVIGVIAALKIPHQFVAPGTWKKHFRLDSDKERSRSLAIRTWPARALDFERVKDGNRAEAALIARYAADVMGSVFPVSTAYSEAAE